MKSFEFGSSLEWVWREFGESPNSLQTHSSFPPKKDDIWKNKNIWAWSEFGESLENLQTHSKLIPLFQRNNEKTKTNENIWVWSEFGESPNSLQTHKEIFAWCHFSIWFEKKREKNEFGESPTSLQKKYACTTLKKAYSHSKKSCARIFFWVWRGFGDSPNSFFHFFV